MSPDLAWMPLRPDDTAQVVAIAADVHPGLPERPAVLHEKIVLFPAGCRRLMRGATMVGYAIAHPWEIGRIPPLDAFLVSLPATPGCLLLHDVAVRPEARGSGSAGAYVAAMREVARGLGLRTLSCVSVYGTTALWARFGFTMHKDRGLEAVLACYGPSARSMLAAA